MKAKYWLIGGISSIAFGCFLSVSYLYFLSKNPDFFGSSTAQAYHFWILALASVGLLGGFIALIVGASLVAFQKSSYDRWHRWYRLLAAGFLLSIIWAIVGASVQTFTGDVLYWLGYQKPVISNYRELEQLFQANNWKAADELTSLRIKAISKTLMSDGKTAPTLSTFSHLPCADFQTIDQLWVKYSSDRFGFSVQRRIYEKLDVPPSNPFNPPADRFELMKSFLKEVERDDAIGSRPSIGIKLSTPIDNSWLFAAEESMKRQKWCGF
jgi:hypothetical protein